MSATGGSRLETAIRTARRRGRIALAAYLTAGHPSRAQFVDLVREIGSVADIVEIGAPFSDPMADGLTIQRASRAALAAGVTLRWILDALEQMARPPAAPLVLMGYLNPFLSFGLDRLAETAARAGVAGLVVPDLPLEESAPVRSNLARRGIALVQLVSPLTPPSRLAALCRASAGFVYAVTTPGTTGGSAEFPVETLSYLDRVRQVSSLPVLAGFGVRRPGHVHALAPHVDGVVVGSALVDALERGEAPAPFLRRLIDGASIDATAAAPLDMEGRR